jgi:hypothetical protein
MSYFVTVAQKPGIFYGKIISGDPATPIWQGLGELFYFSNEIHVGSFTNGKLFGKGKISSNGNTWTGYFENGKLNGPGEIFITVKNTTRAYFGNFVNGKLDGAAQIQTNDGTIFDGFFVDGKPDLIGLFWLPDNSLRVDLYLDEK